MRTRNLTIGLVLLALACTPVGAQTTGVAGTNDLVINGQGTGGTSLVPTALTIADSNVSFSVSANPGASLLGGYAASGLVAAATIGSYTLDIDPASLVLFVDSSTPSLGGLPASNVVPSGGTWSYSVPVSFQGNEAFAFQFGILDPSFAGGLGLTQAHAGTVTNATVYTLPDDGSQMHTLASLNINHYGTSYNSFFINSNGFLTFGSGSSDFTETMSEFFGGWGSPPNPGVAVMYSDLNNGGTSSGGTYSVAENTGLGTIDVGFNNMNHWSSAEPAGTVICSFQGPGIVFVDYSGFMPATMASDDIIIGVTDGDPGVGTDTDLSNGTGTGFSGAFPYNSPGAGDSVGELIPANTAIPFANITYTDTGLNGTWNIM